MRLGTEEDGAEIIEFGLILLPLTAILLLLLDIAWFIFAQASLQYAVREGTRFAVTGQTGPGGQDAAIDDVIQTHAFGFLNGSAGLKAISIKYYSPITLTDAGSGKGSNAGGNVVVISVNQVPVQPLCPWPVWGNGMVTAGTIDMSAQSSDVVEGDAVPPSR